MNLVYRTVFINILKKPQKAFRLIFEYDLDKYQYHLLVVFGVANVLNRQLFSISDVRNNLFTGLVYNIAIGGVAGWIGLFLLSLLIYASGKWLKGYSSGADLRMILSYSTTMAIFSLLLSIVCIVLLRLNNYQIPNTIAGVSEINYWIIKSHFILSIVLNIYFLGLLILAVAVVQGFSILKGLFNVILAFLIIMVPVAILIYFI